MKPGDSGKREVDATLPEAAPPCQFEEQGEAQWITHLIWIVFGSLYEVGIFLSDARYNTCIGCLGSVSVYGRCKLHSSYQITGFAIRAL